MDVTDRFSDRVEAYTRYRPGYPEALVDALGLGGLDVADVGAGTGVFTALLAPRAGRVVALEPNTPMREALQRALPGVQALPGRAEATGLPDASVDVLTCAQAFHWFDPEAFRAEAARVLRPGGRVAVVFNERVERSPFDAAYEAFLHRWSTDYAAVDHRHAVAALDGVLGDGRTEVAWPHAQVFDEPGLVGRILSCSYIPGAGHPDHHAATVAAGHLFRAFARQGTVHLAYDARLFTGPIRSPGSPSTAAARRR